MQLTEQWKIVKHNLIGQHLERTQLHKNEVKRLKTEQVEFEQKLSKEIMVRSEAFVTPAASKYGVKDSNVSIKPYAD